jgi:hypothetical protein
MTIYIQNEDNYEAALQHTDKECFMHYVKSINDFITDFNNNLNFQNNIKRSFIIQKGLDVIRHVFMQFLLYSNNLEFTIEFTEKAYLYYIEFIGQIGEDINAVFNLSSQDAVLFAYKKTIYDIPPNIKKNFIKHDELIDTIHKYIEIYDLLLTYHINNVVHINNIDQLLPITDSLMHLPPLFTCLDTIKSFIRFINIKHLTSVKYFQLINQFIKQIHKKPMSIEHIEHKFMSGQIDILLDAPSNKFIKWILS